MHDGLVIATNGPKHSVISTKESADNMLRVSTISAWSTSSASWIIEQGYETIVITACEKLSIARSGNTVDMGTIASFWIDSLNIPAEFDGRCCPNDWGCAGSSGWILSTVIHGSE